MYPEPDTMARDSITIRLREELIGRLDAEAEERDVSRSEYAREILRQRHDVRELQEEIDDLKEELRAREERVRELEEQLAKRSQIEEKVDTLAKRQEEPEAPFFVQWYQWFRGRE